MPEHLGFIERWVVESFLKLGEDALIGEVGIDGEKCKGCGYCTRACAANSLELHEKKARMIAELPLCIACGDCVAICPEGAISLKKFIVFKKGFRYLDRGEPLPPRQF